MVGLEMGKQLHGMEPAIVGEAFAGRLQMTQKAMVNLTVNGHVITNRQVPDGWQSCYVGRIDVGQWPFTSKWVG